MNTQFNYATGHEYQGKNAVELQDWRESNHWLLNAWVTFIQAKQLGLNIRKGEHGTKVFKGFDKDDEGKSHPLGFAVA